MKDHNNIDNYEEVRIIQIIFHVVILLRVDEKLHFNVDSLVIFLYHRYLHDDSVPEWIVIKISIKKDKMRIIEMPSHR